MKKLVDGGQQLTISGIIKPNSDKGGALRQGIAYTPALTYQIIEEYRDSQGKYGGWRRTRKKGYEGLCFHELRHTQATLLIGSRCDIKTVQHRLGHADVQTTLNIYSHVIDANDEAAAETIAALQI